eukprot:6197619-Pleurochrysis_carterae.AAC.4
MDGDGAYPAAQKVAANGVGRSYLAFVGSACAARDQHHRCRLQRRLRSRDPRWRQAEARRLRARRCQRVAAVQ